MFADKEWPRCQARVCSAPALPGRGDGGGAGPGPAEPFPTDPLLTASFMTDPIPTDPIPTDPIPTGSAPGGMRRGESVPGLFPHLPGFGNSRAGSGRGGIPPGWGWNPTGTELESHRCGASWFLPRICCFRIQKSQDSSVQGFLLPRGSGKGIGIGLFSGWLDTFPCSCTSREKPLCQTPAPSLGRPALPVSMQLKFPLFAEFVPGDR